MGPISPNLAENSAPQITEIVDQMETENTYATLTPVHIGTQPVNVPVSCAQTYGPQATTGQNFGAPLMRAYVTPSMNDTASCAYGQPSSSSSSAGQLLDMFDITCQTCGSIIHVKKIASNMPQTSKKTFYMQEIKSKINLDPPGPNYI